MSKHPDQNTINQIKTAKDYAQAVLREKQSSEQLKSTLKISQKNSTCEYETAEEELTARNAIVTDQIKIIKSRLPGLLKNFKKFFPEIEKLPHNDTLMRLLTGIEVEQIGEALIKCIQKLIRNKSIQKVGYTLEVHV